MQLVQHAQNVCKLKPDKIPAWRQKQALNLTLYCEVPANHQLLQEGVFSKHRALGESTIAPVEDHTSKNVWASQNDPDELLKKRQKDRKFDVQGGGIWVPEELEKDEDVKKIFSETLKK